VVVTELTARSLGFGVWLFALAAPEAALAQQPTTTPPCRRETFRGRVVAEQHHEIAIAPGLVFRLEAVQRPENPAGWTIRVTPPASPDDDYSMVVTPPYRFANARYVDTGYGITAEQALAITPREFVFVATADDYAAARRALEVVLWPYTFTDAEVEAASATLDALPQYPASFAIENGLASGPTIDDPLGRIEWMEFRLDICVPAAP
jgi:hypothetical protein